MCVRGTLFSPGDDLEEPVRGLLGARKSNSRENLARKLASFTLSKGVAQDFEGGSCSSLRDRQRSLDGGFVLMAEELSCPWNGGWTFKREHAG